MSRLKKYARWSAYIASIAAALFVAGFLWFAQSIDHDSSDLPEEADGIVALTGGGHRLAEAYRLLESGRGKRLLITGVNRVATRKEIKRLMPERKTMFDCCVDLDRKALNTIGNAQETEKWVSEHKFRSIIVVTASYHMPRSLTELRRAMPDVKLIPHCVAPRNFHVRDWWRHPGTARVLVWEYVKYVAALGRLGLSRTLG